MLSKSEEGDKSIQQQGVQVHCITNSALSDWKGRFSILAENALAGSKSALRGCYRLLAGREALLGLSGFPTDAHYNALKRIFGPEGCLAKELSSQARGVLASKPALGLADYTWLIAEKTFDDCSRASQEKVIRSIKVAFHNDLQGIGIQQGVRAFSRAADKTLGFSLLRGNFLLRFSAISRTLQHPIFHFSCR